jgi:hypothetical protein
VVALVSLAPADVPRLGDTAVDRSVLAFATLLTLLAVVLCGLAPAWRAGRIDVSRALSQAGHRGLQAGGAGMRRTLVVAEIALSVVLLVAAGLLIGVSCA